MRPQSAASPGGVSRKNEQQSFPPFASLDFNFVSESDCSPSNIGRGSPFFGGPLGNNGNANSHNNLGGGAHFASFGSPSSAATLLPSPISRPSTAKGVAAPIRPSSANINPVAWPDLAAAAAGDVTAAALRLRSRKPSLQDSAAPALVTQLKASRAASAASLQSLQASRGSSPSPPPLPLQEKAPLTSQTQAPASSFSSSQPALGAVATRAATPSGHSGARGPDVGSRAGSKTLSSSSSRTQSASALVGATRSRPASSPGAARVAFAGNPPESRSASHQSSQAVLEPMKLSSSASLRGPARPGTAPGAPAKSALKGSKAPQRQAEAAAPVGTPTSQNRSQATHEPQPQHSHSPATAEALMSKPAVLQSSHSAPSLRQGLSANASLENRLSAQRFNRLTAQSWDNETGPSSSLKRRSTFGNSTLAPLFATFGNIDMEEEDFNNAMDSMTNNIDALFYWQQNFDATSKNEFGAIAAPGAGKRDAASKEEEEDRREAELRRRRERFEAYKMVRKIEFEEIPPLDRSMLKAPRMEMPDQTKVKYNAGPEALGKMRPDGRRTRIRANSAARNTRVQRAQNCRKLMLEDCENAWSSLLEKKMEQATVAKERRSVHNWGCGEKALQRWFATICMVHFAKQAHTRMKVRRDQLEGLAESSLMGEHRMWGSGVSWGSVIQQVLILRVHLMRRRRAATCVSKCLHHWRVGGRAFMASRAIARKLRKIQIWWRECRQRLHEARQTLSARWAALEELEIDRKIKAGGRWAQVSESVRMNFITHELRARRYRVLPMLCLWEEERERWQDTLRNLHATMEMRRASILRHSLRSNSTISSDSECSVAAPEFCWPPPRPSYMPARHPQHDKYEHPCTEDCPGRQGDYEIINMIRRAWANTDGKGGWSEIPACRRRGLSISKNHMDSQPSAVSSSASTAVAAAVLTSTTPAVARRKVTIPGGVSKRGGGSKKSGENSSSTAVPPMGASGSIFNLPSGHGGPEEDVPDEIEIEEEELESYGICDACMPGLESSMPLEDLDVEID